MLRNLIWSLREKCSYLFSWFGKITLELYICSFHILLAADSNGILVFLPGYPVLNILITLFIFICIAHELNLITKSLIIYFIPNNWKFILRNFCVFIILLMPIAIKYGYI
jgi:N-acetylneuraminate 9-O-acetyltransferase